MQVQLLGGDAGRLAAAAVRAHECGAAAVDLNFGCPAKTVNRHDGGATLLKYPGRIREIVAAVRAALPPHVPVSAKLRLGWDTIDAIDENAGMAAEGGAAWITIHGRTRFAGYAPPIFWKPIGRVRERLGIPVVANGDIWTVDDFRRCRDETGCRHFMLGRGALANPRLPLAGGAGAGAGAERGPRLRLADIAAIVRRVVPRPGRVPAGTDRPPAQAVAGHGGHVRRLRPVRRRQERPYHRGAVCGSLVSPPRQQGFFRPCWRGGFTRHPPRSRMERITLATADGDRAYLLHAPASASAVPLVVFLHGAGGTAEWADEEAGWSRLAAREGFALALPEGLPPHRDKPAKFLTNPLRWNDGSAGPTGIPSPADDTAFLAAVLDDAAGRTRINPRRAYVTGFSNGAGMAFRMAAELAPRVAAVAPVAGYCWLPRPQPARPVPTLYVIGADDPLVPIRGGQVRSPWLHRYLRRPPLADTLKRWAAALGSVTVSQVESDVGGVRVEVYPSPGGVDYRVVVVAGLGHHWPGGLGRLAEPIGGRPMATFDATAAIWRFFQGHALS